MNVKKIITLLLALVLAAGMVACGTKPAEDTDGNDGSEEAKALYEQLMAQENAILSENTALWEKVFMAADKGMAMIEDGGNYGDFLLKTIENTKDQFTEEELTLLTGEATKIKDIENQRAELETKYPWLSETPDSDDNTSVPAGSDMTTPQRIIPPTVTAICTICVEAVISGIAPLRAAIEPPKSRLAVTQAQTPCFAAAPRKGRMM